MTRTASHAISLTCWTMLGLCLAVLATVPCTHADARIWLVAEPSEGVDKMGPPLSGTHGDIETLTTKHKCELVPACASAPQSTPGAETKQAGPDPVPDPDPAPDPEPEPDPAPDPAPAPDPEPDPSSVE